MTQAAPFVIRRKRSGIITAICILYWLHTFQLVACNLTFTALMYRAGFRPAFLVEPEILVHPFRPEQREFIRANPEVRGETGLELTAILILSTAGWGLWRLRNWGRWVAIAGSVLSIVLILYSTVVGGLHIQEAVGFPFHSGVLAVLLTRRVRLYFAPYSPVQPRASVPVQEDGRPAEATKYI